MLISICKNLISTCWYVGLHLKFSRELRAFPQTIFQLPLSNSLERGIRKGWLKSFETGCKKKVCWDMLLVHTYSKTKSKIVMNQSNTCINPLKNQTEGLLNRRNVPNSHCPAMFVFCVSFTYDRIYLYEKLKQSHYVCKVQKWRQFY